MTREPEETVSTTAAYLTTKEVADLIRVKERKVYDLAAAGEIPHRRVTGKLLFPAAEIAHWIDGSEPVPGSPRPAVLAGSHDPLLDWAVRESGCGLATLFDGSTSGLDEFAKGKAAACGLHLPEGNDWNVGPVARRGLQGCVLIAWAARRRGLLLAPNLAEDVKGIDDIAHRRVVMRQAGSGTAELFTALLTERGLDPRELIAAPGIARTEHDAASAIAAGEGDIALGIESMAQSFGLGFVPLLSERFDLLIDRRSYFTEPLQTLLRFAATEAFSTKAKKLGGYDISDLGVVRWLSA